MHKHLKHVAYFNLFSILQIDPYIDLELEKINGKHTFTKEANIVIVVVTFLLLMLLLHIVVIRSLFSVQPGTNSMLNFALPHRSMHTAIKQRTEFRLNVFTENVYIHQNVYT